jgi:hypothetical protein
MQAGEQRRRRPIAGQLKRQVHLGSAAVKKALTRQVGLARLDSTLAAH